MKKLVAYKFSQEVLTAIESEAVRTGKTKTAVLEDAVLFQRQFGDDSVSVLLSHYKELVTRSEAEAFWSLRPLS